MLRSDIGRSDTDVLYALGISTALNQWISRSGEPKAEEIRMTFVGIDVGTCPHAPFSSNMSYKPFLKATPMITQSKEASSLDTHEDDDQSRRVFSNAIQVSSIVLNVHPLFTLSSSCIWSVFGTGGRLLPQ